MRDKPTIYIRTLLFLTDILLLNFSILLSYYFRFDSLDGLYESKYLILVAYLNVVWVVLVLLYSPYKISRSEPLTKILRKHFTLIIIQLLLTTAFFVFQKTTYYSRLHLLGSYLTFSTLVMVFRLVFFILLEAYRKKGFNIRNVVVIGYGELSEELNSFFISHPEQGYRMHGFFDKNPNSNALGTFPDIIPYLDKNDIDEIYCCLPYVRYSLIKKLIDFGEDNLIKVKLIADFRGFSFKGLELERYDHIPVLNITSIPLDDKKNRMVKRGFDIAFSSMVIFFVLSWLLPLIALLIKLDSRGPVFFRQIRGGKDNRHFQCLKFRTMIVNNEADSKQATKNDPRITRVGGFLRKTSLDEVPQFINVLLGHMSIIGPRPHPVKLNEEYSTQISKFMARHFVKPGITGLAQAKGYRGETSTVISMKNRVKFDRFYIENWSLFLDIKIIFLTILSLIKGDENAY